MEGYNTKVSNRENSFDLIKFSSGSTTDDLAAAEAWAANDPYALAGLFDSVELIPWKKVIG